jgi:hypothetical protein
LYQIRASRKKLKTRPVHDFGLGGYRVCAEKDCGAEDSFERCRQPTVLLSTIAHAECFQHFGSGFESDRLTLLLDGQRRQEDWNNPVLSEWNPIVRMTGDLEDELAVPPFVKELSSRQCPNWQST